MLSLIVSHSDSPFSPQSDYKHLRFLSVMFEVGWFGESLIFDSLFAWSFPNRQSCFGAMEMKIQAVKSAKSSPEFVSLNPSMNLNLFLYCDHCKVGLSSCFTSVWEFVLLHLAPCCCSVLWVFDVCLFVIPRSWPCSVTLRFSYSTSVTALMRQERFFLPRWRSHFTFLDHLLLWQTLLSAFGAVNNHLIASEIWEWDAKREEMTDDWLLLFTVQRGWKNTAWENKWCCGVYMCVYEGEERGN